MTDRRGMPQGHYISVSYGRSSDGEYGPRAVCTCGFLSTPYLSEREAREGGDRHKARTEEESRA